MDEQKLVCVRCGLTSFVSMDKRRRKDELCVSCRTRPAKSISYGLEQPCKPWAGAFDENDNPLDHHGNLWLPGSRICKHSDCVQLYHIVGRF